MFDVQIMRLDLREWHDGSDHQPMNTIGMTGNRSYDKDSVRRGRD